MRSLVGMDQRTQCIQIFIHRVIFIRTDQINQFVQLLDSAIVILIVTNREIRTNGNPMRLKFPDYLSLFLPDSSVVLCMCQNMANITLVTIKMNRSDKPVFAPTNIENY
jgi:hypothetical protein